MVDLSKIQEKLNYQLSQGFRTVFYIIAKEVINTAQKLKAIEGSNTCADCTHSICEGVDQEELSRLAKTVKVAGETLTYISQSLYKEFDNRFPDADIELCAAEQAEKKAKNPFWDVDEKVHERFHRGGFIVDEMLQAYEDIMDMEIKNKTKEQLYRCKVKENTDNDVHEKN